MAIRGKVKNGRVVLDKPRAFPEGAEVEIRRVKKKAGLKKPKVAAKPKARVRTLAERFANVIGKAAGLPADASINHDHYLYGAPKKQ
jgi:hypothetical protein